MQFDPKIDIEVPSEVYNPSDDSYLLLKVLEVRPEERFLEMGTGSGLVALHAAKAGARVVAADINPNAVAAVRSSALRNDLKLEVLESDLFEKVPGLFDVIAFNPPYLAEESTSTSWIERSWSGGAEGSEVSVRFIEEAWRHLAPKGRVYLILSSLGSLTNVLKAARQRFDSTMLEEKHMFFETMFAYRLDLK